MISQSILFTKGDSKHKSLLYRTCAYCSIFLNFWVALYILLKFSFYIYIYIIYIYYTPGQKYKPTLKKDIIMKIRYMKDHTYRQLNLKYEEISIHFLYVYLNVYYALF